MQRKFFWLFSLINSNLYACYSITIVLVVPTAHLKGNYNANVTIFLFMFRMASVATNNDCQID